MAVIRVMQRSGILFALSVVLAATAAAGPIDDRPATPEVEAAPAPATKGTGVADTADSARSTPCVRSRAGVAEPATRCGRFR